MIDTHHHLWQYNSTEFDWITDEMSVIRQSFLASDLDEVLEDSGVEAAVAVQARTCLAENDFLLTEAKRSEKIQAVVGWVDLTSEEVGGDIDRYVAEPLFKGVREICQGAADEAFFTNPDFHRGVRALTLRDLTYDVLIFQNQIQAATDFIDKHPNQRFVLDHAAKPEIRAEAFPQEWEKGVRTIAEREQLVCKVSGLVTEVRDASWDTDLMRRYVDVLLESFGPERLMFGSDWPVCLLASEYQRWKDTVTSLLAELSDSEREAIYTTTATKFYSL